MFSSFVYIYVYTPIYVMKTRKRITRKRKPNTVLFAIRFQPEEKQRLEQLAEKTGLDQAKLVRRGLALVYEAFNRGQLELGFPQDMRTLV